MSAADEYPNLVGGPEGNRAIAEIDRLRELIRRALADGMDVLDEPDYDLYNELATYLTPSLRPWQAQLIDDMLAQPEGTKLIVNMPPQSGGAW